MFEQFKGNRKGLSPIFATLIILAIVTVLFIPVFIWASGLTSSTEDSWRSTSAQVTERIVIEEVNLNEAVSPQTGTIYVRNIGETAVKINNIIISTNNQVVQTYTGTQFSTVNPDNNSPLDYLAKGDLLKINIENLNFNLNEVTYSIHVATDRGVSDDYLTVE